MEGKAERPKLMVSIVERSKGKDIIKLYDREGVTFHYQTVGRGTATSEIMDILGLESRDKDIILSLAAASLIDQLAYRMSNELRGSVDTKGIFFDLPLTGMSNMIAAAFRLLKKSLLPGSLTPCWKRHFPPGRKTQERKNHPCPLRTATP